VTRASSVRSALPADPSQRADQPDVPDRVRELRPPDGLQVWQQIDLAAVVGPMASATQGSDAEAISAPA